jgi:hypothetical protein
MTWRLAHARAVGIENPTLARVDNSSAETISIARSGFSSIGEILYGRATTQMSGIRLDREVLDRVWRLSPLSARKRAVERMRTGLVRRSTLCH